jgi:hypothetical protein
MSELREIRLQALRLCVCVCVCVCVASFLLYDTKYWEDFPLVIRLHMD